MQLKLVFTYFMVAFSTSTERTYEESLIRLIQDAGYTVEVHKIRTEDNYILSVFRLPSKIPNPKTALLMHGVLSSAADFVIGGRGASLAYLLADSGYDVWLGNSRGNIFSQNHQILDKSSYDFWNFSFHEIGVHDLPAMIDYALKKVNGTSLAYVGHSQGTTVFFVLLTMRSEYHSKISKGAYLMAPVAYMRFPPFYARSTSNTIMNQLVDVIHITRSYEIFPLNAETRRMIGYLCNRSSSTYATCKNVFMVLGGDSQRQFNDDLMPKIFQFTPASVSYKQLVHYGQIINANGNFLQFDHQRNKNLKIYNQTNPPAYKLSNIKAKIHFIYGVNDVLANPKDVSRLMETLKTSTIGVTKINDWNHFDFLFGKDVDNKVNYVIYNKMKSYE